MGPPYMFIYVPFPSFFKKSKADKDGSEIDGSGVHILLNTGETPSASAEEQSEQPTVPQHL